MVMYSLYTVVLLWSSFTLAQYGGYGDTAGSSTRSTATTSSAKSSASSATQTVDVGENSLVFDPDTIHVAPGGKVEFHFYPGNHSVVQASFDNPCHPLSETSFFSGFFPATNGESSTTFTLTVNDTAPIWFYCGQPGHCQGRMVGVINPTTGSSDTLDEFKKAASNANGDSVPVLVQGGVLSSLKEGDTGSATATVSSSSSTGVSSASATNMAAIWHISTEIGILSLLTFMGVAFLA
ncbi:Cupredoxin [Penicillium canariense]|uniref:Cupredoxin n=1 Tax=Penicillium canariense TaxID=189055 RepID=A0A9W9HJZ3_9EURO|nr:Cupredoxin [Penicillium canariense]KAJ5151308.1 Cupredoxin [Penicillium canariense]